MSEFHEEVATAILSSWDHGSGLVWDVDDGPESGVQALAWAIGDVIDGEEAIAQIIDTTVALSPRVVELEELIEEARENTVAGSIPLGLTEVEHLRITLAYIRGVLSRETSSHAGRES